MTLLRGWRTNAISCLVVSGCVVRPRTGGRGASVPLLWRGSAPRLLRRLLRRPLFPSKQTRGAPEVLARLAARLAAQQAADQAADLVLSLLVLLLMLLLRRARPVRGLTVRRRRSGGVVPTWRRWVLRDGWGGPVRVDPGRHGGVLGCVDVEPRVAPTMWDPRSQVRHTRNKWDTARGRTLSRTLTPNLEAAGGYPGSADPSVQGSQWEPR